MEAWIQNNPLAFTSSMVVLSLWSLIWKGFALWKAAELRQKKWFVAILVLNTVGILEIIYLFVISKKYQVKVEVIADSEIPQ